MLDFIVNNFFKDGKDREFFVFAKDFKAKNEILTL